MAGNPTARRLEMHAKIKPLRDDEGLLWREIGERLGIAHQTAFDYYSDPTGEKAKARKAKTNGVCIDCGGVTLGDGSHTPIRCMPCNREYEKTPAFRRATSDSIRRSRGLNFSDSDCFRAMRKAARKGVLSKVMYDEAYKRAPKGSMPSGTTLIKRFDRWAVAVAAAGLKLAGNDIGVRSDRDSLQRLLQAIGACIGDLGLDRSPTYSEYCAWSPGTGEPSGQTIRNRFGSWVTATEAYEFGVAWQEDVAA